MFPATKIGEEPFFSVAFDIKDDILQILLVGEGAERRSLAPPL